MLLDILQLFHCVANCSEGNDTEFCRVVYRRKYKKKQFIFP